MVVPCRGGRRVVKKARTVAKQNDGDIRPGDHGSSVRASASTCGTGSSFLFGPLLRHHPREGFCFAVNAISDLCLVWSVFGWLSLNDMRWKDVGLEKTGGRPCTGILADAVQKWSVLRT